MKKYKCSISNFFVFLILNIVNATTLFAQSERDIQIDILRLAEYSSQYDIFYQSMPTKHPDKMKIAEKKYKDQIAKIKNGPNKIKYIQFLEKATGIDSLKYKNEKGYKYTSYGPWLQVRLSQMPTMLEYFKVVKYSLFTLNKEELIQPKDVPFLKYKADQIKEYKFK